MNTKIGLVLVVLLSLFLTAAKPYTPATQPTLLEPYNGTMVYEATPTYSWEDVPNATYFKLWLGKPDGTQLFAQWYTREQANCADDVCFVSPGIQTAPGSNRWYVKSYNHDGGVWSPGSMFYTPVPAPILLYPSNGYDNTAHVFEWYDVPESSYYKLYIKNAESGATTSKWYDRTQAHCNTQVCWVYSPSLSSGVYTWRVESLGIAGGRISIWWLFYY